MWFEQFSSVTETAAYCDTALLLGLLSGEPVVKWAEIYIELHDTVPSPFFDIVSTPAEDITALRYTLHDLHKGMVTPEVLRAIFGSIHTQHVGGTRSFDDTMRILFQLRYFLKLEQPLTATIIAFEVEYEAAVHDGNSHEMEGRITRWLEEVSS